MSILLVLLSAGGPTSAVELEIGYGFGLPGDEVTVEVRLRSEGDEIAGTQNDIVFDPELVDLGSKFSCSINPDIGLAT